jgi:hypothetical protein
VELNEHKLIQRFEYKHNKIMWINPRNDLYLL